MKMKSALATVVILGLVASTSTAFAADEYNTSNGLTAVGKPLGMHGIDPVAFVDLGNRIAGSARHTATHDGVAYYFSSAQAMKAFKANPSRFLPQNGGFCTFGVSVGKKFDGIDKGERTQAVGVLDLPADRWLTQSIAGCDDYFDLFCFI